jgi:DNA polymerase-3 subunit delta'
MKTFDDYREEHLIADHLKKAVQNERIGQAYIFEGAKGTGRLEMAETLAAALLCKDENSQSKPCGACHSCKLIETGNHPDRIIVTHEKPTTVSVEDIRRQVVEDIDIRPYYAGRKIYIIPDAQMMPAGAQNALLKTIEEPPEYAVIILIVTDKNLLLQTIRSRCMTISFRSEPVFIPEDEEQTEAFNRIENILAGAEEEDVASLMSFARTLSAEGKDYLPELFTHIEAACKDALLIKGGVELTGISREGYIGKMSGMTYERIEGILQAVDSARLDILNNVAAEAVLDALLLRMKEA